MRKTYIIALTTYKEAVRLPLFYVLILLFGAIIFFSKDFTLFGFDKEISVIKEVSIATIGIAGILLAVLLSGTTITSDMERKTAMTILSKPISKNQFVLGKYFGVLLTVMSAVFFLFLIAVLTLWFAEGKPGIERLHDHELHLKMPIDKVGGMYSNYLRDYLGKTIPELLRNTALCAFQVSLMSALSVILSLFFSITLNAGICLLVFLLGHISVYIYAVTKDGGTISSSIGCAFYTLFPNLDYFVPPVIIPDTYSAMRYICFAFLYCLVYTSIVLYTGIVLYNRTELK